MLRPEVSRSLTMVCNIRPRELLRFKRSSPDRGVNFEVYAICMREGLVSVVTVYNAISFSSVTCPVPQPNKGCS